MAPAHDESGADDLEEVVDPNALAAPAPVEMTRVFTDPLQPGKKFTLTLRAVADNFFTTRVNRVADKWAVEFITGRPDPDRPGQRRAPAPLLLTTERGLPAPVETMFQFIAALQIMQVGGQWDVHRWAAVAVKAPTAFGQMSEFANEVLSRANGLWAEMEADGAADGEGQEAGGSRPND